MTMARPSYVRATSACSRHVHGDKAGTRAEKPQKTWRPGFSGGRGRRFESSLPDHYFNNLGHIPASRSLAASELCPCNAVRSGEHVHLTRYGPSVSLVAVMAAPKHARSVQSSSLGSFIAVTR